MHPINCRCVVCLVDRSSFGTPEAKVARASVSDEQAARVVARAKELDAKKHTTPHPTPGDLSDEES